MANSFNVEMCLWFTNFILIYNYRYIIFVWFRFVFEIKISPQIKDRAVDQRSRWRIRGSDRLILTWWRGEAARRWLTVTPEQRQRSISTPAPIYLFDGCVFSPAARLWCISRGWWWWWWVLGGNRQIYGCFMLLCVPAARAFLLLTGSLMAARDVSHCLSAWRSLCRTSQPSDPDNWMPIGDLCEARLMST